MQSPLIHSEYGPKTETFLFWIKAEPARQCCCGCNLKVGVFIISVLSILNGIYSFVSMIGSPMVTVFSVTLVLCILGGYILLLMSTFNQNQSNAYWGYVILAIQFYIKILLYVLIILAVSFFSATLPKEYNNLGVGFIILVIILILIMLALDYYFIYIVYSYTRFVSLGNFRAIEGDFSGEYQGNVVVGMTVNNQGGNQFTPQNNQGYPNQQGQQGVFINTQGLPPQQQQFNSNAQGFPPQQQNFSVNVQGYPPQQHQVNLGVNAPEVRITAQQADVRDVKLTHNIGMGVSVNNQVHEVSLDGGNTMMTMQTPAMNVHFNNQNI